MIQLNFDRDTGFVAFIPTIVGFDVFDEEVENVLGFAIGFAFINFCISIMFIKDVEE